MSKELFTNLAWLVVLAYCAYTNIKQSIGMWNMKEAIKEEVQEFEEKVQKYMGKLEKNKAYIEWRTEMSPQGIEQYIAKLKSGAVQRLYAFFTSLLMVYIALDVVITLAIIVTIMMLFGVSIMENENRQIAIAVLFIVQISVLATLKSLASKIDKMLLSSAAQMIIIDIYFKGSEIKFGLPLEKSDSHSNLTLH